jgi:endoglucanase
MKIITVLLLTVFLGAIPLVRAQPSPVDAFQQNRRLGRGVNIIGYDPIWRARDQARFQSRHFQLLKKAGFNSVRINLHPFHAMSATNDLTLPNSWFAVLDWAIKNCQAQSLNAILDLHEYDAMGTEPEANKEKFLAFWRQLSAHCANEPSSVFFEILNEPSRKLTPKLWNEYLSAGLAIIRQKSPTRTVIVGPGFWNAIDHLQELELPEADRNLIVTVHYYTPMDFTHQGAAWANRQDKVGVNWLGSENELGAIAADFDKAVAWGKSHNRPIFLGEFGAYDKAPMDSRARYTSSIARAAEQRGWSWAYWQFDSDFILYDMRHDAWVEPIRGALIPSGSGS